MADKIQLTPSELQAQATEMKSLESEYESLFGNISSELGKVNSNWSANLAHNFLGKITSTNRSFSQITQDLMNGSIVASTCAVTFETVDSQLAKLYCSETESEKQSQLETEIQTIDDVMQWVDDNFKSLPKSLQNVIKDACKKWFKSGVSAYEIVEKLRKGDYWGAIWKTVGSVAPSTFDWKNSGAISWTGLKVKAVSIVGKLVTDPNGYIQANDEKYMQMMIDDIKDGDILGLTWNMGGSFVQTVGKGTVDATCQLVNGAVDSLTEHIFGISLSTANSIMYDDFGWSPGSLFNAAGKTISNGVDVIIDGGSEFLSMVSKQAYSDIKDFGNLVSDIASSTADVIGSAISNTGKAVGNAISDAGKWIKSWF